MSLNNLNNEDDYVWDPPDNSNSVEYLKAVVSIQSFIRSYLANQIAKKYKKNVKQRRFTTQDFLETERVYVKDLSTIIDLFYTPLMTEAENPKGFISLQQVQGIFCNILDIFHINLSLLADIEAQFGTPESFSHTLNTYKGHLVHTDYKRKKNLFLENIFMNHLPKMKAYSLYNKLYSNSIFQLNNSLSTNKALVQFLKKQYFDPRCRRLELPELLISPIQRIPHYELLFQNLVKYSLPGDFRYQALTEALEGVVQLNKESNQARVDLENQLVLEDLDENIDNLPIHLAEPFRVLVKEEMVEVISNESELASTQIEESPLSSSMSSSQKPLPILDLKKSSQTCLLYLFNDVILWAHPTSRTRTLRLRGSASKHPGANSPLFTPSSLIHSDSTTKMHQPEFVDFEYLYNISLISNQNQLTLIRPKNQSPVVFSFPNEKDCLSWLQILEQYRQPAFESFQKSLPTPAQIQKHFLWVSALRRLYLVFTKQKYATLQLKLAKERRQQFLTWSKNVAAANAAFDAKNSSGFSTQRVRSNSINSELRSFTRKSSEQAVRTFQDPPITIDQAPSDTSSPLSPKKKRSSFFKRSSSIRLKRSQTAQSPSNYNNSSTPSSPASQRVFDSSEKSSTTDSIQNSTPRVGKRRTFATMRLRGSQLAMSMAKSALELEGASSSSSKFSSNLSVNNASPRRKSADTSRDRSSAPLLEAPSVISRNWVKSKIINLTQLTTDHIEKMIQMSEKMIETVQKETDTINSSRKDTMKILAKRYKKNDSPSMNQQFNSPVDEFKRNSSDMDEVTALFLSNPTKYSIDSSPKANSSSRSFILRRNNSLTLENVVMNREDKVKLGRLHKRTSSLGSSVDVVSEKSTPNSPLSLQPEPTDLNSSINSVAETETDDDDDDDDDDELEPINTVSSVLTNADAFLQAEQFLHPPSSPLPKLDSFSPNIKMQGVNESQKKLIKTDSEIFEDLEEGNDEDDQLSNFMSNFQIISPNESNL